MHLFGRSIGQLNYYTFSRVKTKQNTKTRTKTPELNASTLLYVACDFLQKMYLS